MKITAMVAAMAAVGAWAGDAGPTPERTVTVCVDRGINGPLAHRAKGVASKMFAEIGVRIDWRFSQGCPVGGGVIAINFSYNASDDRFPGAFAYALPFEGTHIVVFYDRVQRRVDPARMPLLLAHVLVHEITPILEGTKWHSASGIMKAQWDHGDYVDMARKSLGFTRKDVELIYLGLDARESRLVAAATAQ